MSTASRQRVSIAARPGSPLGWPGELRGPRENVELAERFRGVQVRSERGGERMGTERPELSGTAADVVRKVAVVAHRKKTLGGGLEELRKRIAEETSTEPLWYEVSKSRKAPKRARAALKEGADLVFVWGGDGIVQRCLDVLSGSATTVAIVPAGTANLLAGNLGIPKDLPEAVRIGFHGSRRKLDLGKVNGEHFAVMAGVGFDAAMIGDADRELKDRLG